MTLYYLVKRHNGGTHLSGCHFQETLLSCTFAMTGKFHEHRLLLRRRIDVFQSAVEAHDEQQCVEQHRHAYAYPVGPIHEDVLKEIYSGEVAMMTL